MVWKEVCDNFASGYRCDKVWVPPRGGASKTKQTHECNGHKYVVHKGKLGGKYIVVKGTKRYI